MSLIVCTFAGMFGCADVARNNQYDSNAPLSQQALAGLVMSVSGGAADANAATFPLPLATLTLTGPANSNGTTDIYGNANMTGLTPGTYTILVSDVGFYDETSTVTLLPGQTVAVDVALRATPATAALASTGQVVGVAAKSDQLGFKGADNSGITVSTADVSMPVVSGTTDVNGEFTLAVMPGPHTLVFSAAGYTSVTFANVVVTAGATVAPCAGDVILQKN